MAGRRIQRAFIAATPVADRPGTLGDPLTVVGAWAATGAAMATPSPDTETDVIVPLAAGFAAPDREAWLALVDKTLKGAPVASLTRETLEGLPILPLYEAAETAFPARAAPGWDARTEIAHGDAATANAAALGDLAEGARSLLAAHRPGGRGAAWRSARPSGLARALDGVHAGRRAGGAGRRLPGPRRPPTGWARVAKASPGRAARASTSTR